MSEPVSEHWVRGHFGDESVKVCVLKSRKSSMEAPLVTLLHGVHGCADMSTENKYGRLARMLNSMGAVAITIETSRLRRDRETFGDDRESWAWAAFRGKTFADDHADVLEGLCFIHSLYPDKAHWIWGFSLGGIHAVTTAGGRSGTVLKAFKKIVPKPDFPIKGIITSGSGDSLRPEAEDSLKLPILDSMPPVKILHEAAGRISAEFFVSFRGSMDETFSEAACRRIVELAPLPEGRKIFQTIEGADHAFRTMYGRSSTQPLEQMTERLAPLLHPGPTRLDTEIS